MNEDKLIEINEKDNSISKMIKRLAIISVIISIVVLVIDYGDIGMSLATIVDIFLIYAWWILGGYTVAEIVQILHDIRKLTLNKNKGRGE